MSEKSKKDLAFDRERDKFRRKVRELRVKRQNWRKKLRNLRVGMLGYLNLGYSGRRIEEIGGR